METPSYRPHLIVIALLLLTSLAIARIGDVKLLQREGVFRTLPDRVGGLRGAELRYCQDPACLRMIERTTPDGPGVCPACGGSMDAATYGERLLLPADTILTKKRYRGPAGGDFFVTLLFSGKDRLSIHRPQNCLHGQGFRVGRSRVVPVGLPDGTTLRVRVLDLERPDPRGADVAGLSAYAYWFVGKDRATPYQSELMFRMGVDRVFRGTADRWAFISITTARSGDSDAHVRGLTDFISALYPLLRIPPSTEPNP